MSQFMGILSLSENIDVLGLKNKALNGGSSLFKYDSAATYETNKLLLVNWINPIKIRQIAKCKIDFLININNAHGKR